MLQKSRLDQGRTGRQPSAGRDAHWRARLALTAATVLAGTLSLTGCATLTRQGAAPAPPGSTYTGPVYLRGTIGSLTQLRNNRPILVSGYGLVVNLHATGSSEVPAFLRQFMINRMRKRGLGSAQLNTQNLTPARVLADKDTAVVAVRGLVPPGAVKGTRFDVVVSALAGTQTTSLADGRLWTTPLSIAGTDPSLPYVPATADAHGSIYIKPRTRPGGSANAPVNAADDNSDFVYNAVVLSGGRVTRSRKLYLALNQPSWMRSRAIADRINERFPMPPSAIAQTADAKNDLVIELNIPTRYQDHPEDLVVLIQHLFLQQGNGFAPRKAEQLLRAVARKPGRSHDAMLACQALGRTIIPVLRNHYDDSDMTVRMTALQAGARLGDERSSRYLYRVAQSKNATLRRQAAKALVYLPRSLEGSITLKQLLNDTNMEVRLAAYESLTRINDPIIKRVVVHNSEGQVKFVIDLVPAHRPLIFVTQTVVPRIVVFKPMLGFNTPMLQTLWNDRLMMRQNRPHQPLSLYYQSRDQPDGKTYKLQPTVATLAYMLGHNPTMKSPQDGLDLSYSQVVDVLFQLCRRGAIAAPIKVRVSPLAQLISQARGNVPQRPAEPGQTPKLLNVNGKFQVPVSPGQGQPRAGGGPDDQATGSNTKLPLEMRRVAPPQERPTRAAIKP